MKIKQQVRGEGPALSNDTNGAVEVIKQGEELKRGVTVGKDVVGCGAPNQEHPVGALVKLLEVACSLGRKKGCPVCPCAQRRQNKWCIIIKKRKSNSTGMSSLKCDGEGCLR